MNIRKYDIVSILRDLIADMVITVKVSSSTDNGDGTFTLSSCNTQYLNDCTTFTVDGNVYSVLTIENDSILTVQGSPVLTTDFDLRAPLFIPDTPKGANNETVLRADDLDRNPFIWLLEDFRTEFVFDGGPNVSEPRLRLFFLNASENPTWLETQHRENCIEPMQNLCDRFIKELEYKISGKIERFTIINRLRFGNSSNNRSILDESLSGVELDITIPVKKWAVECKDC